MTKRTLAGILCLLLALLIGIGGECYLRGSVEGLLAAADLPEGADGEALFSAARKAAALWNRRQLLLGVLLKHSDADALGKLFLQLEYALRAQDAEACAQALGQCRTEAAILLEGERFCWDNILHINGKKLLKSFTFLFI